MVWRFVFFCSRLLFRWTALFWIQHQFLNWISKVTSGWAAEPTWRLCCSVFLFHLWHTHLLTWKKDRKQGSRLQKLWDPLWMRRTDRTGRDNGRLKVHCQCARVTSVASLALCTCCQSLLLLLPPASLLAFCKSNTQTERMWVWPIVFMWLQSL